MSVGVQTDECPVSMITETSKDLVQIFLRSKTLAKLGSPVFSPGEIDAKTADAFVLLQSEEDKVEEKITEAEIDAAKRARQS